MKYLKKISREKSLPKIIKIAENFILQQISEGKRIHPMIATFRGKEVEAEVVLGGRDEIRKKMSSAKLDNPDYIVVICEVYSKDVRNEKSTDYSHGNLEKEFLENNKSVKEGVCVYVLSRGKQLLMFYEIDGKTIKKVKETDKEIEDIVGYLAF